MRWNLRTAILVSIITSILLPAAISAQSSADPRARDEERQAVKPPGYDETIKIIGFDIEPKVLPTNRITNITFTVRWQSPTTKLFGADNYASFNFVSNNWPKIKSNSKAYWFDSAKFNKKQGTFKMTVPYHAELWTYLDVYCTFHANGNGSPEAGPVRLVRDTQSGGEKQGHRVKQLGYDFVLYDKKGKPFRLSDHRGKVVLIDFSSALCGFCLQEAEVLEDLYQRYKDDGLVVITALHYNFDARTPEKKDLRAWARKYKATFPILSDPQKGVYEAYRKGKNYFRDFTAYAVPYNFLIGRAGKIRYRKSGFDQRLFDKLENKIIQLLAEEVEEQ